MPQKPFASWSELVRIAHQRFSEWTGGSAPLWQEGQGILGPNGAALAFGIALQKHALGETDRPAAYFAGIVEKARTGRRCDLNASIRGLAEHVHASSDRVPSRTRGYPPLPATSQQRSPPMPNGRGWRPPVMKRALKGAALFSPDDNQEGLPFFPEPEVAPIPNALPGQTRPAPGTAASTFYDEEGRFVPRCACGAYGTFGVGVSLRQGKEGTWWCGPCWRALGAG